MLVCSVELAGNYPSWSVTMEEQTVAVGSRCGDPSSPSSTSLSSTPRNGGRSISVPMELDTEEQYISDPLTKDPCLPTELDVKAQSPPPVNVVLVRRDPCLHIVPEWKLNEKDGRRAKGEVLELS